MKDSQKCHGEAFEGQFEKGRALQDVVQNRFAVRLLPFERNRDQLGVYIVWHGLRIGLQDSFASECDIVLLDLCPGILHMVSLQHRKFLPIPWDCSGGSVSLLPVLRKHISRSVSVARQPLYCGAYQPCNMRK
jgi:hypothetical protein